MLKNAICTFLAFLVSGLSLPSVGETAWRVFPPSHRELACCRVCTRSWSPRVVSASYVRTDRHTLRLSGSTDPLPCCVMPESMCAHQEETGRRRKLRTLTSKLVSVPSGVFDMHTWTHGVFLETAGPGLALPVVSHVGSRQRVQGSRCL